MVIKKEVMERSCGCQTVYRLQNYLIGHPGLNINCMHVWFYFYENNDTVWNSISLILLLYVFHVGWFAGKCLPSQRKSIPYKEMKISSHFETIFDHFSNSCCRKGVPDQSFAELLWAIADVPGQIGKHQFSIYRIAGVFIEKQITSNLFAFFMMRVQRLSKK